MPKHHQLIIKICKNNKFCTYDLDFFPFSIYTKYVRKIRNNNDPYKFFNVVT